jgi:hypothetical protein
MIALIAKKRNPPTSETTKTAGSPGTLRDELTG